MCIKFTTCLSLARGLRRDDLGREKFLSEVWEWRRQKGERIFLQLERMGAALEWDRTCFTLSEVLWQSQDHDQCFKKVLKISH